MFAMKEGQIKTFTTGVDATAFYQYNNRVPRFLINL